MTENTTQMKCTQKQKKYIRKLEESRTGSVKVFNAYMYTLPSSSSLQPQLGPEAFKIPNYMTQSSNH